ncbi:unnamed protein product [Caretta caretta]
MEQLWEDVTCSICLDVLKDPLSIECGHNFCRGCLTAHWSQISAQGHRCPECRAPCSGDRMIPDTHVKNLAEKIAKPLQEETELQGPGAQREPGRPVQLVHLDEEENLILDEEALSRCLEQGGVGDAPVCLVSIIGEQRRGKSFLLNYLLRCLRSPQDARDGSWMGREDEPLEGFEWRADEERVTNGVWAWSQPFWVPAKSGKVAVLLVDTEGSMDIESNKETSIKLSAFSMLLSSYQILNTGCRVKDPDLEYLEMFVQVAEVVGEAYGLEPIQHLDLLVRDWSSSRVLGAQGGEQHLRQVRQNLSDVMKKHRFGFSSPCQDGLSQFMADCLTVDPSAMAEQFMEQRRSLLERCQKEMKEPEETLLTALKAELTREAETFLGTYRRRYQSYNINQRVMDRARQDHADFLREKVRQGETVLQPGEPQGNIPASPVGCGLWGRRQEFISPAPRVAAEMGDSNPCTGGALISVRGVERSCCAVARGSMGETGFNPHLLTALGPLLSGSTQDGLSQRMFSCLTVTPSAMAEQFVEKRRSLLERCREEMKEPEETLLTALEEELTREANIFLETYRERYLCHLTNLGQKLGQGLILLFAAKASFRH